MDFLLIYKELKASDTMLSTAVPLQMIQVLLKRV